MRSSRWWRFPTRRASLCTRPAAFSTSAPCGRSGGSSTAGSTRRGTSGSCDRACRRSGQADHGVSPLQGREPAAGVRGEVVHAGPGLRDSVVVGGGCRHGGRGGVVLRHRVTDRGGAAHDHGRGGGGDQRGRVGQVVVGADGGTHGGGPLLVVVVRPSGHDARAKTPRGTSVSGTSVKCLSRCRRRARRPTGRTRGSRRRATGPVAFCPLMCGSHGPVWTRPPLAMGRRGALPWPPWARAGGAGGTWPSRPPQGCPPR